MPFIAVAAICNMSVIDQRHLRDPARQAVAIQAIAWTARSAALTYWRKT